MPNLSELQADLESADPAVQAKAGKTLADYHYVYNQEWNALKAAEIAGQAEYDRARLNPTGVNVSDVLALQGLVLSVQSRMTHLDLKMMAFQNSGFSITPPAAALIAKVKSLSEQVAKIQVKANAVKGIMTALTQLAQATDQIQGA